MTRVIGSRLFSTALVLFGVSLVVFLLLQLVPGDPAVTILGSGATASAVAELRSELGLDRALPIQFFDYLGGLLRGDLGRSLTVNAPVTDIMVPRFVNTMILTGAALLLCIVIAVPLGVIAAHKQYSLFDRMSMVISMAGANGMRCSTPRSSRPRALALNKLGVPPPKKIELIGRPCTAASS